MKIKKSQMRDCIKSKKAKGILSNDILRIIKYLNLLTQN